MHTYTMWRVDAQVYTLIKLNQSWDGFKSKVKKTKNIFIEANTVMF